MTRSVYVASPEGQTGKSAVALGLVDALTREVGSVGIFRPLTTVGTSSGEISTSVVWVLFGSFTVTGLTPLLKYEPTGEAITT